MFWFICVCGLLIVLLAKVYFDSQKEEAEMRAAKEAELKRINQNINEIDERISYTTTVKNILFKLFGDETLHRSIRVSSYVLSRANDIDKKYRYLVDYFDLKLNDSTISYLNDLLNVVKKFVDNCNSKDITYSYLESHLPTFKMIYTSDAGEVTRYNSIVFYPDEIIAAINGVSKLLDKQKHATYRNRCIGYVVLKDTCDEYFKDLDINKEN